MVRDDALSDLSPAEAQRLLNAVLRNDLVSFIGKSFTTVSPADRYAHNWHIEALAYQLERCRLGYCNRLIVTLPPRSLKSICTSVAFPAWVLGQDPTCKIICASYSAELSAKHSRDCRAVMESKWYRRIFQKTRIDRSKNTELEYVTTKRGFRLGTSVGGTLTGRGGNILIIDDPLKPADAESQSKREALQNWYDGTLYSRLDNKREGIIIIVTQRLHLEDLVGHVLDKEDWCHISLPATAETEASYPLGNERYYQRKSGEVLHPEREPAEALTKLKSTLGSYHYSAQYQQSPVPIGGSLIDWEWFQFCDELPERETCDIVVQSWDTASKASEIHDYSVGTTWLILKYEEGYDYYLLDLVRERLEYPYLKERILEEWRRYEAKRILIEDRGSGTGLIQDLKRVRAPVSAYEPQGDKVVRMSAQSAKIEQGFVWLPERADWLEDFRLEVLTFPLGRHDDQVDSLSQLLNWHDERRHKTFRVRRLGI